MSIEITFLGTSQAVPTPKRNHSSILLRYEEEMMLIDCGEGTQRQIRIAGINPCKLTRILITHWHGDHVLGIPGLLWTLTLNGYNKTLHIYGPKGTKRFLELMFNFFVFVGKIDIKVKEVTSGTFIDEKDFYMESFPVKHGTFCNAYSFREKNKRKMNTSRLSEMGLRGEIVGKLQRGESVLHGGKTVKPEEVSSIKEGRKIAFLLDTKLTENCFKVAENADLLISESSYSSEMKDKAEEYKHLTSSDAATIAKKSDAKRLILTHVSQRHAREEDKILKEAKKIFKNTELAKDFMKIKI